MRTLITCIGLAAATAWSQNFYYLPTASDGVAGDGTVRTTLVMSNPGVRPAKVTVAWTNDDGSPRQIVLGELGSNSNFSLVLAPGALRIFATDGAGDGSGAAVKIGSDQVLQVWGVRSTFDGSGALRGETSFAAVGSSTGFRVPVDSSSGIALYNPGPGNASLTATLMDSTGAAVSSETLTLDAGARVTRPVSGDLSGWGTLDVTSSVPVAAQLIHGGAAILEASTLTSKRMKYYFPRLADGPSITATLRTTFLLTNLSKKPANVTIGLTREDGSPWTVAIPGMDPNNAFQTTLEAGASAVWQTDGAGPYAAGAATVQADAPVSVQALVAAFDSQGTSFRKPRCRMRGSARGSACHSTSRRT